VNLAAKLVDGQQIYVPPRTRGGQGAAAVSSGAAGTPMGAGGALGASGVPGSSSTPNGFATTGASPAPISLSTASQAEFETLDGIGPALAQRIIEFRDQHGGFQSIEQLREVSGIGDKRFEALKAKIVP
jgi:competence protein ComEA